MAAGAAGRTRSPGKRSPLPMPSTKPSSRPTSPARPNARSKSPSKPRGTSSAAAKPQWQLSSIPFFAAPEKWSDRPVVFGSTLLARIYRALPLSYSVVGALMWWYGDNLSLYDPQFCWQALGYSLMAQGPVSYLADVQNYGCTAANSTWKRIDLVLAPTLTFLVSIVLVTRCWLGHMSLPTTTTNVWAAGCVVAVLGKCVGAHASHQKSTSIETLMVWANVWHSLPVLASLIVWHLGSRNQSFD